jgi:Flp pilus assembly protein TadB
MTALPIVPAFLAAVAVVLLQTPRRRSASDAAAGYRPARTGADRTPLMAPAAGVAAGICAWAVVGGWPGLVLGSAAGSVTWWWVLRIEPSSRRLERERVAAALPLAVDLMAAALGAGLAPSASLEVVVDVVRGPIRERLSQTVRRLQVGVDPVTVWTDLGRDPELGVLGRTISRALQSGSAVAESLARLSEDLRADQRAAVEARARTVGVKAAIPLGVCLLPAFVLLGVIPLVAGSLGVVLP